MPESKAAIRLPLFPHPGIVDVLMPRHMDFQPILFGSCLLSSEHSSHVGFGVRAPRKKASKLAKTFQMGTSFAKCRQQLLLASPFVSRLIILRHRWWMT